MISAIIIAKGHSRRIPRKNMQPLCGRPLFSWSVIQALSSHLIDEVFVSTDDREIADVTTDLGASVIWRPILHPDITANPIFVHAIEEVIRKNRSDTIIPMLPTSPLLQPYDLDEAVRIYQRNKKDKPIRVVTIVPELETLVYRKDEDGKYTQLICDKSRSYATQGGCFSICSPDTYLNTLDRTSIYDSVIDEKLLHVGYRKLEDDLETFFYILEEWQQFEVDEWGQLAICEALMKTFILRDENVYDDYRKQNLLEGCK